MVKTGSVFSYKLKAPGDHCNIYAILNIRAGFWFISGKLSVESSSILNRYSDDSLFIEGFAMENSISIPGQFYFDSWEISNLLGESGADTIKSLHRGFSRSRIGVFLAGNRNVVAVLEPNLFSEGQCTL